MTAPALLDESGWQAHRGDYDAAVLATPGVMKVCSSSYWQWAAHRAFGRRRAVIGMHRDGHFACFAANAHGGSSYFLEPLEALWGFGCPLVGPTAEGAVDALAAVLAMCTKAVRLVRIAGLPATSKLPSMFDLNPIPGFETLKSSSSSCDRADLSGGFDAYWARRGASFRSNCRRIERRCRGAGIELQYVDSDESGEATFARIRQIEAKSWKAGAFAGFLNWEGGCEFYATLASELGACGKLRAVFARHEDRDIAYAFGGVFGAEYRGFQLTYDDAYSAFGLGHLVQLELLRRLPDEGVRTYDLGMSMDYKARFRDEVSAAEEILLRRID